jgi:uncharacterized protein
VTDLAAPRFACDNSLGGLARWLRAAGYEARCLRDRRGDDLLREARAAGEVLLTSDHHLFERRAVRSGEVRAVHVPSEKDTAAQLGRVLGSLGLPLHEPRCMPCGGELRAVEKAAVRERIPPRTALWREEYWVCSQCDRLFWKGTHWERIQARLRPAGV